MARRITPEQMVALSLASLANARRLLDDAEFLRSSGRTASAFTIAGLAADELGKHILVFSFYRPGKGSDEDWTHFWRRFRNHESKLGDALLMAWTGDLLSDDPLPDIKQVHARRLSSTYVDLAPDGAVESPDSVITQTETAKMIATVRTEVEFCEGATSTLTVDRLAALMVRTRNSSDLDEVSELERETGAEGALAFVIARRAGMPHEEALTFARFLNERRGRDEPVGSA